MAFPVNPTVGDRYYTHTQNWEWDGGNWQQIYGVDDSAILRVNPDEPTGQTLGVNALTLSGKAIGATGNSIPLLDQENTFSATQLFTRGLRLGDQSIGYNDLLRDIAQYRSLNYSETGALVVTLGRAAGVGTFLAGRLTLISAYGVPVHIEFGGYYQATNVWFGVYARVNGAAVTAVRFARDANNWPCLILSNHATPTASTWGNYLRARLDHVDLGWIGADNANSLNTSYYTTSLASSLDAYVVDATITPALLPAGINVANTWTATQAIAVAGAQLLLHPGSNAPTAMWYNNTAQLQLLLSDASAAASSIYNALRPFSISLTTGAVSMAHGLAVTGHASASRWLRSQAAPATQDTAATLTSAQMGSGILTAAPSAAIDLTLPTGTTMEEIAISAGQAYDLHLINTSAYAVTLNGNTGHTLVGNATLAANTSAHLCIRKTATNTFTTYRVV